MLMIGEGERGCFDDGKKRQRVVHFFVSTFFEASFRVNFDFLYPTGDVCSSVSMHTSKYCRTRLYHASFSTFTNFSNPDLTSTI